MFSCGFIISLNIKIPALVFLSPSKPRGFAANVMKYIASQVCTQPLRWWFSVVVTILF